MAGFTEATFLFFFFFPLRMTKESPHLFQLPLILEPIKGLSGEAIKTATAPKQEQSLVQIPWRKWMSFLATDRLNRTKNKSEQSDFHLQFIQHCIMASALMFILIGFITLVSPTEKSQGSRPRRNVWNPDTDGKCSTYLLAMIILKRNFSDFPNSRGMCGEEKKKKNVLLPANATRPSFQYLTISSNGSVSAVSLVPTAGKVQR